MFDSDIYTRTPEELENHKRLTEESNRRKDARGHCNTLMWHVGEPSKKPLAVIAGASPEDRLKHKVNSYKSELGKELANFYRKKIAWRVFWFYKVPRAIKALFKMSDGLCDTLYWLLGREVAHSLSFYNKIDYGFEFTLTAIWDQLDQEWKHSGDKKRGPDWRISLPWKKKTRGFPQFTCYLKKSIEMKLGLELTNLIIDILDGLMFDMKTTSYNIRMFGERSKIDITVVERVKKIKCA